MVFGMWVCVGFNDNGVCRLMVVWHEVEWYLGIHVCVNFNGDVVLWFNDVWVCVRSDSDDGFQPSPPHPCHHHTSVLYPAHLREHLRALNPSAAKEKLRSHALPLQALGEIRSVCEELYLPHTAARG